MADRMHGSPRGGFTPAPRRDSYVEPRERERRGGGGYDAGPGGELLPTAEMMDRPKERCGTFERHGDGRTGINRGIRKIQDAGEPE